MALGRTVNPNAPNVRSTLKGPLVIGINGLFPRSRIFRRQEPTHTDLRTVLIINSLSPLVNTRHLLTNIQAGNFRTLRLNITINTIRNVNTNRLTLTNIEFFNARRY